MTEIETKQQIINSLHDYYLNRRAFVESPSFEQLAIKGRVGDFMDDLDSDIADRIMGLFSHESKD